MKYFLGLLLIYFFSGCSVKPVVSPPHAKVMLLAQQFVSLDQNVSHAEAQMLALDIFDYTAQLTQRYDLVSPPMFHNFLVNTGMREGGLCYQWSDALYAHLRAKKYLGFEFHLAVANEGEYFGEHNALVVVQKGGKVEEGIIVDPWRHSGELFFAKFKEDPLYQWKHRLNRCQCKE
ncbi:MAG: hypothetical protein QG564_1301 [Campylobacterota bacterium]|nr:hypothetical protein [Campylobacterota bacterium]